MQMGYARFTTTDQRLDLQCTVLINAGVDKLFANNASSG